MIKSNIISVLCATFGAKEAGSHWNLFCFKADGSLWDTFCVEGTGSNWTTRVSKKPVSTETLSGVTEAGSSWDLSATRPFKRLMMFSRNEEKLYSSGAFAKF